MTWALYEKETVSVISLSVRQTSHPEIEYDSVQLGAIRFECNSCEPRCKNQLHSASRDSLSFIQPLATRTNCIQSKSSKSGETVYIKASGSWRKALSIYMMGEPAPLSLVSYLNLPLDSHFHLACLSYAGWCLQAADYVGSSR